MARFWLLLSLYPGNLLKNSGMELLQAYKNYPLVKMVFVLVVVVKDLIPFRGGNKNKEMHRTAHQTIMSVAFVPLDEVLNCLYYLVQDSTISIFGAPVSSYCRFSILFSTDLDRHFRS